MLAVVGAIPYPQVPVTEGEVLLGGDTVRVSDLTFPLERGTAALLASARVSCDLLGLPAPYAFLVGDEGLGMGSAALYRHIVRELPGRAVSTLVFHYLQPDLEWHDKTLFAIDDMPARPRLIADAGFMYAAKMSGQAGAYDLFTPDAGELAFLADENAPHPFYTRGFILHEGQHVPDLIRRAYRTENAATCLLVKGETDYVADKSGVLHTVDSPREEAMEAIGGTGDTLTGMVAALAEAGRPLAGAARTACRANRLAGSAAGLDPGSSIARMIEHLAPALQAALAEEGGA